MSTSDKICNDGVSKSSEEQDGVCDVSDMLQKMSTANKNVRLSMICANCGKEGANNICAKCKQVKYCNAVCKKVHKKKHKKDCEEHVRLAAEHAARLHEEKLFKQPPPEFGDCPICFQRLPTLHTGSRYYLCCGKTICSGCIHAPLYDNQGNRVKKKCPFCRTPHPASDEEIVERTIKRVELEDPMAMLNHGNFYFGGLNGYSQDYNKALELWHRASELGLSKAFASIGYAYHNGQGVEVDKKKARYYYELAAMGGSVEGRYNLGCFERDAGNIDRALKHLMIAVGGGLNLSLERIKEMYSDGYATKEDYTKALQSYQVYLGEIKSVQRDKLS